MCSSTSSPRASTRCWTTSSASHATPKSLPDGRNAHLIQQGRDWWLARLGLRFTIHQVEGNDTELVFVVQKKLDRFGGLAVY
jgi:hypothetical protein